ncbi:hypothetical protein D3C75_922530 [compost metagenome]
MIDTSRSRAGSMPLSSTFCTLPSWVSRPCIWVKGATATTCGFCFTCWARAGQSAMGWPLSSVACGIMPNTRVRISWSKPFITESTTIITTTPRARPIIEVREMNETK